MEHFCKSNQSSHISISTGFLRGKIAIPTYPWIPFIWFEKQNHAGIETTKSAAEDYLSANSFNPHSCITIDYSCIPHQTKLVQWIQYLISFLVAKYRATSKRPRWNSSFQSKCSFILWCKSHTHISDCIFLLWTLWLVVNALQSRSWILM